MSSDLQPPAVAKPAANLVNISPDAPFLRFPPFPQVPEGVTILPFDKFQEHGIQMFTEDGDDELDGLGIPTVELRVKHDTDVCKTNAKRKKKKKVEVVGVKSTSVRKEWWEQWQEGEDLRLTSSYNPNMPRIDRLFQAAYDFSAGRTWPPSITGVRSLWDQFRLFVGLLANTPIWHRAGTGKSPQDDEDSLSDDDIDQGPEGNSRGGSKTNLVLEQGVKDPSQQKYPPRRRPRPPYANYGEEAPEVDGDEAIKKLLDEEAVRKEEKLTAFLNDPEITMKIFLSSYMRKQGLIWSDRNLVAIPRLVSFFINFLLRNRVLPETTHERGLRRALEVVEMARKELPLTAKIAKVMPDNFSLACQECWGIKADGYKRLIPEDEAANEETDEPHAKRPKLDDPDSGVLKSAVEEFEAELKAANVEVIKAGPDIVMADAVKDILADTTSADNDGGWGSTTSGAWGSSADYDPSSFTPLDSDPWAAPTFDWAPPEQHSLVSLLGPTALPITHTTGVVEWSLRKIKMMTLPPTVLPKAPTAGDGEEEADPEGVEVELQRRFAKVVLEPWLGWDSADEPILSRPRILETSRGPVVLDSDKEARHENGGAGTGMESTGMQHDPLKDNITILVEPDVLSSLSIGMGLGATWVQLARHRDDGQRVKRKKKKGKGKAKEVVSYWYMDELMMIFPSYYTA